MLSAFRRSALATPRTGASGGGNQPGYPASPRRGGLRYRGLAQIAPGGELTIVNCGHHPPLLRHGGGLQPLADGQAALPLGLDDDFTAFLTSWSPGDRLLLYTDGLVESRDQHGNFFPQEKIATALLAADCDHALDTLTTAVHRHTGGSGHDDMALLLLEQGMSALSRPTGTPPGPLPRQSASARP